MSSIFSGLMDRLNLLGGQQAMPAGFVGPQQPPVQGPPSPSILQQIGQNYQKISEQPGFNNAMLRLGTTLLAAREQGMGLGEGLMAGQSAYNSEIDRAKEDRKRKLEEMLLQAQTVKALTPKVIEPTAIEQQAAAAGFIPGTAEYQNFIRQAVLKPSTQINLDQRAEGAGTKAYKEYAGKAFAETANKIAESGRLASTNISQYEQLNNLLDQVQTGKGAETGLQIKKGIKAIGSNPEDWGLTDDVGSAEASKIISSKLALELRNPAGGAGMPGSMSDQDRLFLQNMTPDLLMTKEGRNLAIDWNKKVQQRNIEVSKLAREYKKLNNGMIDDGFDQTLADYSAANPLFNENDRKKLNKISVRPESYRIATEPGTFQQNIQQPTSGWSIKRIGK